MNDEKTIDMSYQEMLTNLAKIMVDRVSPDKWETILEDTRKKCIGKPEDEFCPDICEAVLRFTRQEINRIHRQRLN